MSNSKTKPTVEAKTEASTWSPALLDSFGGDIREVSKPGDVIGPEYQEGGVRHYATNSGWSGNVLKLPF